MPSENGSGISLYDLIENAATAPVRFPNGKVVQVRYKPDRLTPARLRRIQDDAERGDNDAAPILLAMAEGWDLTGPLSDADGRVIVPAGEPIPFDAAHIDHVPGPILGRILRGVAEHANPEASAPAGPSRGRSFTQGR